MSTLLNTIPQRSERLAIKPAPLEPVNCELLDKLRINLRVLRLDQIHPRLHGNKWFKLKHNIEHILERDYRQVLSFGGAYSNNIAALATAGRVFGFDTIGLIRGELPEPLNPVLSYAVEQGMSLIPLSRTDYRRKHEAEFQDALRKTHGDFYLLPEGGSNALAVRGCEEIADSLQWQGDGSRYVALASGTGATLAGLLQGVAQRGAAAPKIVGISVLKAPGYLQREVKQWLQDASENSPVEWQIVDRFHCGGYARSNAQLSEFTDYFKRISEIPVEPVYTGKMLYGVWELMKEGVIEAGSEVIAIHTGGIHQ